MSRRVFILGVVLLIRMFAGGIASWGGSSGQILKVTGDINKITHTVSKVDTTDTKKSWQTTIQVGQFLATKSGWEDLEVGQRVQITGRREQDLLEFWLGKMRLSEAKIVVLPSKLSTINSFQKGLESIKNQLITRVSELVPSPEAELISGMTLGAKRTLPADFKDALVRTGTIHIVVASGFNVTLIGAGFVSLLLPVCPRFKANLLATIFVWGYVLFTGAQPPVVRAAVMCTSVTLVGNLGLPLLTGWVLLLSGWLMLMIDPGLLVDTSFQLTIAATAGLVWLVPQIEKMAKLPGELAPTLAAQVSTAPIMLLQFGQVSLIAPLVNLLVLPLVAPLTIGGSFLVLVASINRYISLPLVWFCYGLSHLFVLMISAFSRWAI